MTGPTVPLLRLPSMQLMELPSTMVVTLSPNCAKQVLAMLPPGLPLVTMSPRGMAGFYGIFRKPRWFRPSLIVLGR